MAFSYATRAFSTYVLPEEDIEVKVSNFYAKIKEPVLASPKLAFPDAVRATKMYPSPLPDIFKGEQLVLVGRYAGDGSGKIVLEGTVNGETRKFHYDAKFPADNSGNDFIPRLWATRRIGYLLDEIRLRGESKELKDEVTDLARQFGVVTPYTAYLILEDEDRRHVPRSAQSLPTLQSSERDRSGLATAYVLWTALAPVFGIVGLAAGAVGLRTFVRRAKQRRLEAFIVQMPELARVLANATNDGYTLGAGPTTPMSVMPHLMKNLKYSVDSFEYICQSFENVFTLSVPQESPYRSVA